MHAAQPGKGPAQARAATRPGAGRARVVPWWRRINGAVYATVGVVAAMVIIFVLIAHNQGGTTTSNTGESLASAAVAKQVTQVSPSVIDAVGAGGTANKLQVAKGAQALVGADGKPQVVYIGADYCPFCAAERWSLIVALARFGTFSNLHNMESSSTDVYPSTPTFTFYGSTYTSQYIEFQGVETLKQDEQTTLQTPTAQQQHLLVTYDVPPYTSQAGSIPFLDIGGPYVLNGAGFDPQLLQGWTRDQIAAKLSNPNDPVTKAIVGHANYLTAAICAQTQGKPADVCADKTIQNLMQQLPKGS
jgi:hypothetical protein